MGGFATRPSCNQGVYGTRKSSKFDTVCFKKVPWQVQIRFHEGVVQESTLYLDLQVRRPDGEYSFSVRRTLEEFRRAHEELMEVPKELGHLPDISTPSVDLAQLQQWMDEALNAGLLPESQQLQDLIGLPNSLNLWAAPGTPSLAMLAECHEPLLLEIASYVTDSPSDLANLTSGTSRQLSQQIFFAANQLWGSAFGQRWPAFHECLEYASNKDWFSPEQDWKDEYRNTLLGKREYTLEVFDREKKLGFAMAAMAARVNYDHITGGFVANYLSASEVLPESIPAFEGHRLRFCPASAREQLGPGVTAEPSYEVKAKHGWAMAYPYKVLEGFEDLVVGQGVELQWKMQFGSPFGWWYGHLERLERDPDGRRASATITFRHFPSTSRWYRLDVRFGDSEMQPCSFGGYTGGIRAASPTEHRRWMRYFPKDPVIF